VNGYEKKGRPGDLGSGSVNDESGDRDESVNKENCTKCKEHDEV
jgi:hypothetical protein